MTLNIKHFFTSEAVSEGHPDKVCDQISDAILDAAMDFDSHAHVACETLATTDTVVLAGEVNPIPKDLDYEKIVRGVVAKIGYDRPSEGFSDRSLKLQVLLHGQSADIARGVSEDTSLSGEQGAGDQGIMFGFACNETPAYMPAPIYYSHRIVERLAELRHTSPANYGFLRPDAKSQLTFEYEGNTPVAITQAVVSTQHLEGTIDKVRELVPNVLREVIPAKFLQNFNFENINGDKASLYVNPTGNFVIGGPHGDAGVTGRKIIVDTYGGAGRHGGGAFSGKDPSKVDRSASYMARYVVNLFFDNFLGSWGKHTPQGDVLYQLTGSFLFDNIPTSGVIGALAFLFMLVIGFKSFKKYIVNEKDDPLFCKVLIIAFTSLFVVFGATLLEGEFTLFKVTVRPIYMSPIFMICLFMFVYIVSKSVPLKEEKKEEVTNEQEA